jgi:hypothetical protein
VAPKSLQTYAKYLFVILAVKVSPLVEDNLPGLWDFFSRIDSPIQHFNAFFRG